MLSRKIGLGLLAASLVVTMGSALEVKRAYAPGKSAVNAEKKAVGTVNMKNVSIKNKTSVDNSAVAGNTGVAVKGKNINMKNVRIDNKTKVKNSAVHGNTGVKIKAKNVNMKNVNIKNKTSVKNSAVAGNTGVEIGN